MTTLLAFMTSDDDRGLDLTAALITAARTENPDLDGLVDQLIVAAKLYDSETFEAVRRKQSSFSVKIDRFDLPSLEVINRVIADLRANGLK